MIETLPEAEQNKVSEHLQEYISDIQSEARWESLFKKTENQLVAAARRAKQEIAQGLATPMDYEQL
jgi:hypothetical protein